MADDDAGARMRRRQFAAEVERLKTRQSGLTPRHQTILEGVYELEPKPDWRTEARLASQLGLDALAVTTWFRARRVKAKRNNLRVVGTVVLLVVFVVLGIFYLWQLNGEGKEKGRGRGDKTAQTFFFVFFFSLRFHYLYKFYTSFSFPFNSRRRFVIERACE